MTPPKAAGFHDNKDFSNNSVMLFLKKGVTQLRVLPAYSETGRWFREIKEIPLYREGKFNPVVSPTTIGEPCGFETEGRRLYNLKGEENIEKAKKFRPRSSFLFNVVVQSQPDFEGNIEQCVRVLKCGVKVFRQILDLDQDHSGGWGDITNLEKGFDLRITRTGTGRNDTEYVVKGVPKQSNILDWLGTQGFTQELSPHDLDAMYNPPDAEEITRLVNNLKAELSEDVPTPDDGGDPFRDVKAAAGDYTPEAPIESDNTEVPALEQT